MTKQKVIEALYKLTIEISEKYHVYKILFKDDKSINILAKYDYGVFAILKASLANDLMMCIFKILDPEKSCDDANLSFKYLDKNFDLSKQTKNRINHLYELKKKVKQFRHKRLSHNDLKRQLNPLEYEDISFSWLDLSIIIETSQTIINDISREELGHIKDFVPVNVNPELLLHHLNKLAT